MRTKYVLAVAAASAFLSVQAASAEPVPSFTWSGFYYGGHFGASIDQTSTGIAGDTPILALLVNNGIIPSSVTSNPSGPLAGLQLGYNFQRGTMVYGVEADLSLAAIEGKSITATAAILPTARYTTTVDQNLQWFSTLRGRLGFTYTDKVLIYGTGGLALGWSTYNADVRRTAFLLNFDVPASANVMKAGWTVGLGAEYALQDRWSFKAEYLYYDLGKESITGTIAGTAQQLTYNFVTRGNIVRLGLNRKFN